VIRFIKIIKFVLGAIAVYLVVGVLFVAYVMHGAPDRMAQTCSQITVGMSPDDLTKFSAANDLFYPPQQTGTSYVADKRSFGRYTCAVEWESGKVKSARVNFAD